MSLSDLASLGSFVSGFAVLISLIFLYFQLRQVATQVAQAEKNQQASIRQGRTGRSVGMSMGATNPALAEALVKFHTGAQDITAIQLFQCSSFCRALFFSYEDNFYQHQEGLLSDSAYAGYLTAMGQVLRMPSFRVQWTRNRAAYGTEFAEFMDKLIARTPVVPTSFDTAEWLIAFAAERSASPT